MPRLPATPSYRDVPRACRSPTQIGEAEIGRLQRLQRRAAFAGTCPKHPNFPGGVVHHGTPHAIPECRRIDRAAGYELVDSAGRHGHADVTETEALRLERPTCRGSKLLCIDPQLLTVGARACAFCLGLFMQDHDHVMTFGVGHANSASVRGQSASAYRRGPLSARRCRLLELRRSDDDGSRGVEHFARRRDCCPMVDRGELNTQAVTVALQADERVASNRRRRHRVPTLWRYFRFGP